MCWSFATILIILFCPAIWTTEIYSLSLHDALPIYDPVAGVAALAAAVVAGAAAGFRLRAPVAAGLSRAGGGHRPDRKSTRLNSSHPSISYAVLCLKKKMLVILADRADHIAFHDLHV